MFFFLFLKGRMGICRKQKQVASIFMLPKDARNPYGFWIGLHLLTSKLRREQWRACCTKKGTKSAGGVLTDLHAGREVLPGVGETAAWEELIQAKLRDVRDLWI